MKKQHDICTCMYKPMHKQQSQSDIMSCMTYKHYNIAGTSVTKKMFYVFITMFPFLLKAQLLNTMCGAKVKFTITSESGRQVCGSFPSLKMRHVGLQAGQPAEAPFTRQSATQGTPKKTPAKLAKQIANMPGKKEKKMSFTQKAVNKCAVCGIIFNSAKDKLFKKKHRLQGEWLGCEKDGCEFWGHAICAKVKISSRKNIPSIQLHGTHP